MTVIDLPELDSTGPAALPLLGSGAAEVLEAVFAPAGATVVATVPRGATYQPGRSLTVRHDATVRWPDARVTTEELVLCSGRRAPRGATVVSDGSHDVVVWRIPADPWLPGLSRALDPESVAPLLARLGFAGARVQCKLRAYRPGRRAVVEVSGPGVRAFLKVVRPGRVEALHRRHELLADVVPVPAALGWSADHGIVVLQALPGQTLRDAVRRPVRGTDGLPPASSMLHLLERLPEPDTAPRSSSWRVDEFVAHLSAVVPELSSRLDAIAAQLAPFEAAAAADPVVPVHGDFYEAQLLVDRSRITGLLDVDTFGWGRRVDDLATYLAHLVVLAEVTAGPGRDRVLGHARHALATFDRAVEPAILRAGIAAVVLGLATGPFRVLEPRWRASTARRVELAEAWLGSAHAART
jgi:aminoglycoside phosphotransferase (APT) family kinase protein